MKNKSKIILVNLFRFAKNAIPVPPNRADFFVPTHVLFNYVFNYFICYSYSEKKITEMYDFEGFFKQL